MKENFKLDALAMRNLSIVIPVYNEALTLAALLHRLNAMAETLPDVSVEYVFVDDHSQDDSFFILQQFAEQDDRIRIIRLSKNRGSHMAIFTGMMNCRGDVVCTIPADLQTPPELVPDMLAKLKEGYRTVWAYRRTRNGDRRTLFFSRLYDRLMDRFILPGRWNKGADVFLIERSIIPDIRRQLRPKGNLFALLAWLNIKPVEIGYDQEARYAGESKWSFWAKCKLLLDTLFTFSPIVLRILMALGLLLTLGGFVFLNAIPNIADHWAHLTAAIILLVCGVQFVVLSIAVEYIWRITNRPNDLSADYIEKKIGFPENRQ